MRLVGALDSQSTPLCPSAAGAPWGWQSPSFCSDSGNSRPGISGLNWLGYVPGLLVFRANGGLKSWFLCLKKMALSTSNSHFWAPGKTEALTSEQAKNTSKSIEKSYVVTKVCLWRTVDLSLVKLTYIFWQTGLWTRTGIILPNGKKRRDLLLSLFFTRISFLCIVSYFIMSNMSCHLDAY